MALASVLTLGLVTACGPDLDVDPRVVLGHGSTEFGLLQGEEPPVDIVSGIQGGRHIFGAVRAIGLDWRECTVRFDLTDAEGFVVSDPTTLPARMQQCPKDAEGCESGMGELVGVQVILEDPWSLIGEPTRISVEVSDEAGRSASDSYVVIPQNGEEFDSGDN